MPRRSTAVAEWRVPGAEHIWVRLHAPGKNHASWRITFPTETGVAERTRRTRDAAEAVAKEIVAEFSTISAGYRTHEPIRNLVAYYRGDWAAKREWTATYRQERDRGIARLPGWFLDLPCGAWRVSHSEKVLAGVANEGFRFGSSEYQRVGSTLSGMVTAGFAADFLPPNTHARGPMHGVKYQQSSTKRARTDDDRKDPLRHLRPITDDEIPDSDAVTRFARQAGDMFGPVWEAHALLLAFSGPRIAETLALQENDFALAAPSASMSITKQIQQVRTRYTNGATGVLVDVEPKNGILRTSWIPPHIVEPVQAAIDASRSLTGSKRVFSKTGTPMTPDRYRSEIFNPVATALGWARVPTGRVHKSGAEISEWQWTVHSLRHHAATWMLRTLDMSPVNVAITLGHSNSLITERLYLSRSGRDFTAMDGAVTRWLTPA